MTGPLTATLLLVAKAPVPGQAKTRLTPPLTPHQSAALAAAALLDTIDAVRLAAAGGRAVVALTGDLSQAAASAALGASLAGLTVVPQRGETFAERLVHAHVDAAGQLGATVQIGMDTPQVRAEQLRAAADRVTTVDGPDAVLGLAEDGGWWALGLRRARDARLLDGVPMSTPATGALTLAALRQGGLRVELLAMLRDVDDVTDIAPVAEAAPGTRFAALAATLAPVIAA